MFFPVMFAAKRNNFQPVFWLIALMMVLPGLFIATRPRTLESGGMRNVSSSESVTNGLTRPVFITIASALVVLDHSVFISWVAFAVFSAPGFDIARVPIVKLAVFENMIFHILRIDFPTSALIAERMLPLVLAVFLGALWIETTFDAVLFTQFTTAWQAIESISIALVFIASELVNRLYLPTSRTALLDQLLDFFDKRLLGVLRAFQGAEKVVNSCRSRFPRGIESLLLDCLSRVQGVEKIAELLPGSPGKAGKKSALPWSERGGGWGREKNRHGESPFGVNAPCYNFYSLRRGLCTALVRAAGVLSTHLRLDSWGGLTALFHWLFFHLGRLFNQVMRFGRVLQVVLNRAHDLGVQRAAIVLRASLDGLVKFIFGKTKGISNHIFIISLFILGVKANQRGEA